MASPAVGGAIGTDLAGGRQATDDPLAEPERHRFARRFDVILFLFQRLGLVLIRKTLLLEIGTKEVLCWLCWLLFKQMR